MNSRLANPPTSTPVTGENRLLTDVRARLGGRPARRICLVGLGNPDLGDDGFGVRLAELLAGMGCRRVINAGTAPERFLGRVLETQPDHVVFLDAVDFGGVPGTMVFLNTAEMESRFPQVSTHRLSLGLLARCVEAHSSARAWLLGAQPASLQPGHGLSPVIQTSLGLLQTMLGELLDLNAAEARAGEFIT